MSLQSRLTEYLSDKSLTFRDFERLCGLSNGTAARLRETTRKSTFDRIAISCDLNIEWLLTGEGEMTIDTDKNSELKIVGSPKEAGRLIPFYDAETTGGYDGRVSSSTE